MVGRYAASQHAPDYDPGIAPRPRHRFFPLHERLNVDRRDRLHIATELRDLPPPVGDHLKAGICDHFPRFGVVGGERWCSEPWRQGWGTGFRCAPPRTVWFRIGMDYQVDSSSCALPTQIVVEHEAVDGDD